jgi:hypothetical protein
VLGASSGPTDGQLASLTGRLKLVPKSLIIFDGDVRTKGKGQINEKG